MRTTNQRASRTLPPAVIFDVDGTFVDVRAYVHHFDVKDEHYVAYHHAVVEAPANENVFELLYQTIEAGIHPLVVTARSERWRDLTHGWITRNGFHPEDIFMRVDGDMRDDDIIKSEILAKIQREWNIVAAIDDNPRVVALWESASIPTIVVPGAYTNGDPKDMEVPAWWFEMIRRNTRQNSSATG